MSSLCHALRYCAAARSHVRPLALATTAAVCLSAAPAFSAAENVLYSFIGAPDGDTPYGNLTIGADGSLYGATAWGGAHGNGAVYKLIPFGSFYSESIIYSFKGGADGANPYGAPVIDEKGNVYGTTSTGGSGCDGAGCGTVYELSPAGDKDWKESVLYRMRADREGDDSLGGLTRDARGNLYGTTASGGHCDGVEGSGTVFQLSRVDGQWKSTVLSTFCRPAVGPAYGTVAVDSTGSVYGAGGSIVFRLAQSPGAGWQRTTLHDFAGDGYASLIGGVTLGADGNIYGTNASGGSGCDGAGCGTVFELQANRGWKAKTLYTFHGEDGNGPFLAPVRDATGNLYGTTIYGGDGCGDDCGLVYKLTPRAHGAWRETVLHSFGSAGDGYEPLAGVTLDASGNLFGVTTKGGDGDYRRCDCGVVYELPAAKR